jgi:hypothetical protein
MITRGRRRRGGPGTRGARFDQHHDARMFPGPSTNEPSDLPLHGGDQGFESPRLHVNADGQDSSRVAQMLANTACSSETVARFYEPS